jgi:hypothetical protein
MSGRQGSCSSKTARRSLVDAEKWSEYWPLAVPIISGWPLGVPTAPLSKPVFDLMLAWAFDFAAKRGGNTVLLWNQAEDVKQAAICDEFNTRVVSWLTKRG